MVGLLPSGQLPPKFDEDHQNIKTKFKAQMTLAKCWLNSITDVSVIKNKGESSPEKILRATFLNTRSTKGT